MKRDYLDRESPDIALEASAWIAQIETDNLTDADKDALKEWLSRSPRHVSIMQRMARVSEMMNELTELTESLEEAVVCTQAEKAKTTFSRRGFVFGFSAVAATMLLGIGVLWLVGKNSYQNEPPWVVTTEKGGYKEEVLSDGTMIKINTDSRLEVHYTREERKVRLLYGEAYFEVASNPERPFVVYTQNQYVRAVGTAFLVRALNNDAFSVSVVEGTVEVAKVGLEGKNANRGILTKDDVPTKPLELNVSPRRLTAGHRLTVDSGARVNDISQVPEQELERELAWQQGLLEFSDTSLQQVMEELSRYYSLDVQFIDPSLKTIKFGGIFLKSNPDALFEALEQSYGIQVVYLDKHTVALNKSIAPQ